MISIVEKVVGANS